MNRRSLFKLLAGAACAAAIELTGLIPKVPKVAQWEVNLEYLKAEFEDIVIFSNTGGSFVARFRRKDSSLPTCVPELPIPRDAWAVGSLDALRCLPETVGKVEDFRPRRYKFADGQYHELPYYILKS